MNEVKIDLILHVVSESKDSEIINKELYLRSFFVEDVY